MEILERFSAVSTRSEIAALLGAVCHEVGYDYFVYVPLILSGTGTRLFQNESEVMRSEDLIAHNTLLACPPSWLSRYQQAQHVNNDPIVRHISRSTLPIFWSDALLAEPDNVVLNEAAEHGLRDGITVSIGDQDGRRALMSFSRSERRDETRSQMLGTAAVVQLTAHYVHEALGVSFMETRPATPLTAREQECLRWCANGKTSWEIAQILGVSERTVVFHLTNATTKLNATNRRQAVARALSLRLITL